MSNLLTLKNFHVSVNGIEVLRDISLCVPKGEIHILMGPNGSGKSTLAQAIMGSPLVMVTSGSLEFEGEDITHAVADERAQKGLYLGFQYPAELPGVGMASFVRNVLAYSKKPKLSEEDLILSVGRVGLPAHFLDRNVNEGFSGGEKKRNEVFQLRVFQPRMAIMDEFDSGLDVDGLRLIAKELTEFITKDRSLLLITHQADIGRIIQPDRVHIMKEGRIVESGGKDLLHVIGLNGFESF
ncbi:MAG: Fe-S cluster assembly ATPase SufC [bacterium]|nr:Fe-S cluster assembly ATPase SufC [bacterium]